MASQLSYVTMRTQKKRTPNDSIDNSFISTMSDLRARSLPDLSTDYNEEQKELVETLKTQLVSAHTEIEELLLKNSLLVKENEEKQKTINNLTKICSGSASIGSSRRERKSATKMYQKSNRPINSSAFDLGLPDEILNNNEKKKINIMAGSPQEGASCCKLLGIGKPTFQSTSCSKEGTAITNSVVKPIKPKIFIVGSQQCSDLASHLILHRQHTQYEEYDVTAYTRPLATADHILKDLDNFNIQPERDQVIIGVGENDTNPTKLMFELAAVLKRLEKFNVFILGVNHSRYLNEVKLNKMIENLCTNTPNCTFIEIKSISLTHEQYLTIISRKISFTLDCKYYDKKFLDLSKIKQRLDNCKTIKKPATKVVKQRTITSYFFGKSRTCAFEPDVNSTQINDQSRKKRDLRDYFPIITKRDTGEGGAEGAVTSRVEFFRGPK